MVNMSLTQTNTHRSTECVINDYLIRERERERDLVYGVGEETLDRLQKNKCIRRKKKKKKGLFFLPILSE